MARIPTTTKNNYKGWEYIPIVKLGELLKEMIWFTGKYILNKDKTSYERYNTEPYEAYIQIPYRKQPIEIKCKWITEYTPFGSDHTIPEQFAIGIKSPDHIDFQHERYHIRNLTKYAHSRFYNSTIDKIEDAIYNAQIVIDNEIIELKNENEQRIRLEQLRKNLCENLDVSISKTAYVDNSFTYKEDYFYTLQFQLSEVEEKEDEDDINNTENLFEISELGGKYTEAEIKKIIEIVGGNPRAITERLMK